MIGGCLAGLGGVWLLVMFSPRRLDWNACGRCGYDLHGLELQKRCPECGSMRPPSPIRVRPREFLVYAGIPTLLMLFGMTLVYVFTLYPYLDLFGWVFFVGFAGIAPVLGAMVMFAIMRGCHPLAVAVAIGFGGLGAVIANLLASISAFVWNPDAQSGIVIVGFPIIDVPAFGFGVLVAGLVIPISTMHRT